MNSNTLLLASSVIGLGLLANPAAVQPAFQPEEGAELTKRFEQVLELTLDDLGLVADGQDVGDMIGSVDLVLNFETSLEVSDEYRAVGEGRPTELARTYGDLDSKMGMSFGTQFASDDQEVPATSELTGSTVVFTWDDDEEAFEAAFEDGGDDDLLEGLEEDMDLRSLLPTEEVSEGDTWEIALDELGPVFMPGGNLSLLPEEADEGDMEAFEEILEDGFEKAMDQLLEGSCTCTYKGSRELDGVQVAEIQMQLEISSSADLSDLLIEIAESIEVEVGDEMPEITIDVADLTVDFEGEGVLLWNLDLGLLHSFEISGGGDLAIDLSVAGEMEGESHSFEVSADLSGTWQQSVSAE